MTGEPNTTEDGFFTDVEPGRKGEILDAAAGVFAERGYDGGSMREIAGRVGVSEPALYRHFPGKEAIFLAIMRLTAGRMKAEAFALIDGVTATDLRSQLIAAFADRRRAIRRFAPILRTLLVSAAHNPQFLAEFRTTVALPMRERLAEKAADLDAAFGIANAEATRDARVRSLMALFVGYFVTSAVLEDEPDADIAEAAMRVMGWGA